MEDTTEMAEALAALRSDIAGGEYSGGGYRYIEATPDALRTIIGFVAGSAERERRIAERAWDQGHRGGSGYGYPTVNPYRPAGEGI